MILNRSAAARVFQSMGVRGLGCILAATALGLGAHGCTRGPRTAELAAALRASVEGGAKGSSGAEGRAKKELRSSLERFYALREHRPVFIFPNHFNVYLYDTPAGGLFSGVERDFSHGCICVERPLDLARYVLRDQPEWTLEKIEAAMSASEERTVELKAPIPVHIEYWTAWVDPSGVVHFRDDVHRHEEKLARLLARPSVGREARAARRVESRS